MRSLRAPMALSFAFAAVLAAMLAGAPAAMELALFAGPLLLVAGLLVSGRYVGEERILARLAAHVPGRVRPARIRWSRRPGQTLPSLLERAPQSRRGPSAPLTA